MKSKRHDVILSLIENNDIETQEELQEKLEIEGFKVTQATISRDIRYLKLTKIAGENGKQKYTSVNKNTSDFSEKYIRVLREAVVRMDTAQNILVIKTVAGMAMAVAAAVDSLHLNGVVGCIAGDDTVFCAISDIDGTYKVKDRIEHIRTEK
ncbi:MAG: arginine repressor [Lachnospiraceae bacterium]|nr:arginine repressor [Lachnospiraceae bacterium]